MISFEYETEKEADEVLEDLGDILIQEDNIIYLAVIKKINFEIEVGTKDGEKVNLRHYLEEFPIIARNVSKSNFPDIKRFPEERTTEFYDFLSNFAELSISTKKTSEFYIKDIFKPAVSIGEHRSDFLRSGIDIGNSLVNSGPIGAIFQIENFPNEYFGISNWHILGFGVELGSNIIHPGMSSISANQIDEHKCGSLFWSSNSTNLEVAFAHFDMDYFKGVEKNFNCGYRLSGKINTPKINETVKHCGGRVRLNNTPTSNQNEIHSVNAIIKANNLEGVNPKHVVYKNQILINKFSDSGDSGAVVLNKNNDVVGLIFSKIDNQQFSVANNINLIFNKWFETSQKVKINDEVYYINQFKLKTIF